LIFYYAIAAVTEDALWRRGLCFSDDPTMFAGDICWSGEIKLTTIRLGLKYRHTWH